MDNIKAFVLIVAGIALMGVAFYGFTATRKAPTESTIGVKHRVVAGNIQIMTGNGWMTIGSN